MSKPALRPTQPPIRWERGAVSSGVKRPGSEADHSQPSSAKVKNELSCTSIDPISLNGVGRDNFTFTFTFTFKPRVCLVYPEGF
jgi:hypothetical protein